MKGREADRPEERLFLRSKLSDVAQLPVWIESLASRHPIPENVAFAINLCLEEAVSNIILHGFAADSEGSVEVRFTMPRHDLFVFLVEDDARHFNPLNVPTANLGSRVRVGGQGIHFLRQFADELKYEMTPTGNRLRIAFSAENIAQ
jgi:anti-sigma regulatory factor (Ser/Thr protein kinase)